MKVRTDIDARVAWATRRDPSGFLRVIRVDFEDRDLLEDHRWCIKLAGRSSYAARRDGSNPTVYLHRAIMERVAGTLDGLFVDHVNREGLDCRRENLRIATPAENARHSATQLRKTSGLPKGVSVNGRKFRARIFAGGRSIFLGSFATPEAAGRAYDDAARHHFGAWAFPNDLPDPEKNP